MQTPIQEMLSVVEMDFNNGIEISMKVFSSMLKKALQKEKEQLITFHIEVMRKGLMSEGVAKWKNAYEPKIRNEAEQYYLTAFKKKHSCQFIF